MPKRRTKKKKSSDFRLKLTPAGGIGAVMGLGLVALGLWQALVHDQNGGYYVAVLGAVLTVLVAWRSV